MRTPKASTLAVHADDALPDGVVHISEPLARLTYRLADLPKVLSVSRRTIERERSAGRFPKPDIRIGKAPLWKPETIAAWVDRGGNQ